MTSLNKLYSYLSDEVLCYIKDKPHYCVQVDKGTFIIQFDYRKSFVTSHSKEKVTLYCDNERFLMVSNDVDCQKWAQLLNTKWSSYHQMNQFFNEMLSGEFDKMENYEKKLNLIEDLLLKNKKNLSTTVEEIVSIRRELLKVKQYYQQLSMILEDLVEQMEDDIDDVSFHRFISLKTRIEQYANQLESLRNLVSEIREVYQTNVDMQQNQLMKIFTVITTIFTPLTLITGWYGMNFIYMPELMWEFGYYYAICLSLGVSLLSFIFFKVKKWF